MTALSKSDKELMEPSLLAAKEEVLKKKPKLNGEELILAVCDNNMPEIHGQMKHHVYLYLWSHFYEKDTQKWLAKLLLDKKEKEK